MVNQHFGIHEGDGCNVKRIYFGSNHYRFRILIKLFLIRFFFVFVSSQRKDLKFMCLNFGVLIEENKGQ